MTSTPAHDRAGVDLGASWLTLARRSFAAPPDPTTALVLSAGLRGDEFRVVERDGEWFVLKRRPLGLAWREMARARAAARRLKGLRFAGLGVVRVVVPTLVPIADCAVLMTPYLGASLDQSPSGAAELLPADRLQAVLASMLDRGVEFSGFVPRNLLAASDGIAVIDWEDARFVNPGSPPSAVTTTKWDIAWSEVHRRDLELRYVFKSSDDMPPAWDGFEQALAGITNTRGRDPALRPFGIHLTLSSEMYCPYTKASAADLGHRAADALPPELELLHTAVTALVRETAGEHAFAELVDHVAHAAESGPDAWVQALVGRACGLLHIGLDGCDVSDAAATLGQLRQRGGWDAAVDRAGAACTLLAGVAELTMRAFDRPPADVLLRGSTAQGVLGLRSDVDFEVSSPHLANGDRGVESVVLAVLRCFGLRGEGSAGRPPEVDLADATGDVTRDVHEWCELRRPGSPSHDAGWIATRLLLKRQRLTGGPSTYERRGRERSTKYFWFEVRAAISRIVFSHAGDRRTVPVRLPDQLKLLPELVPCHAAELSNLARLAFDLREWSDMDAEQVGVAARRLDAVREELGLPGPVESIETG